MSQLTLGVILDTVEELKRNMTDEEIKALPIYLGDDDELNGIHCGWYVDVLTEGDPLSESMIELINEDGGNIQFQNKAILVS